MNNKKLICSGITKKYGKKEVLHKVDLELEPGKIYGLIGRNGAGKTTLLSIMSAQNPTTQGQVLLGETPVWENQEALKHIYFSREINPNSTVYSGLKVKEHLKIAAAYLPNWDQEMADRLVTLFHLDKKKRISKLSKGMASMLTIVTALASKADFTFLDEPVAGLDVVAREQFYRLLVEEFTESGRTFVVSTHIIEEASDVFEEVIFLHEGEILLKENTQELLEHCVYVSGKTEAVEEAVKGKEIHARQVLGRSQGVMVRLKEEEQILPDGQITLQHMNLQKIFVSLCSGEDEAV
nr:ABC transporter ATP-binding protein [uncultured Blautia sp.]